MIFYSFFLILLRDVVVCNDNKVDCSPEGLPELPQDALYYPFISKDLVENIFLNYPEEIALYYVFGESAAVTFYISIFFSFNALEINFYSPYDSIRVTFLSTTPLFRTVAYNITRIEFAVENYVDFSFYAYESIFYFFKGGHFSAYYSEDSLCMIYPIARMYDLNEFNRLYIFNFKSGSYLNFRINIDQYSSHSILIHNDYNSFFGVPAELFGPTITGNFSFHVYFTKNSDFQTPIDFQAINKKSMIYSAYNFSFYYVKEDRELDTQDHNITLLFGQSMEKLSFDKALVLNAFEESPNIHINIQTVESDFIEYRIYSFNGAIKEMYPITIDVLFYTNIEFIDEIDGATMYCHPYMNQEDSNKVFDNLANVIPSFTFMFSGDVSINLSKITVVNEIDIVLIGCTKQNVNSENLTNSNHITIIDVPSTECRYTVQNCNLTFVPEIVYALDEPQLINACITNYDVMNITRVYCSEDDLTNCINAPPGKTHVVTVFFLASPYIYFGDNFIYISSGYRNPFFYYGENENMKTYNFIFIFDFLFYSVSGSNIQLEVFPSIRKFPNITIEFRNYPTYFYLTFGTTFQTYPVGHTCYFQFHIDSNNFNIINPPNYVFYDNYDPLIPTNVHDKSPIFNNIMLLCIPNTFCTGQIFQSDTDYFIYRPDMFSPDFEMAQSLNRIINSLENENYFSKIVILYSTMLFLMWGDPLALDPYEKLQLDQINSTIHFTTEYPLEKISFTISSSRENNADTWIVENVTITSLREWKINNLFMIDHGVLIANSVISTNVEIDSDNLIHLNSMTFTNCTIRLVLNSSLLTINILSDSIGIYYDDNIDSLMKTKITPDSTLTFLISQNDENNEKLTELNLSFYEIEISTENDILPRDLIFKFEEEINIMTHLTFTNNWANIIHFQEKVPLYTFVTENYYDLLIKNLYHTFEIMHLSNNNDLYFKTPITVKRLFVCLSSDDSYCHNLYNELNHSEEIDHHSFFKQISSQDEFYRLYSTFLNNPQNISIYHDYDTEFNTSNILSYYQPKYFWIESPFCNVFNLIYDMDVYKNHVDSMSIKCSEVTIIEENMNKLTHLIENNFDNTKIMKTYQTRLKDTFNYLQMNDISINNGKLYAKVNANSLISTIFDYHFLQGSIKGVVFNYSSDFVMTKVQTSLIKSIPNINIEIQKDTLLFDSFEVNTLENLPFETDDLTFELWFNITSTLTFSISEFPLEANRKFTFKISFLPLRPGYIDTRSLTIVFDESWQNFSTNTNISSSSSISSNSINNNVKNIDQNSNNDIHNANSKTNKNTQNENSTKKIGVDEQIFFSILSRGNNIIYYVIQEVPTYLNLTVQRGSAINRPTSQATSATEDAGHLIIVSIIAIAILLVAVVVGGIFLIIHQNKKIKKIEKANDV
ncbi:hypothetical protein TRFO_31197 [Tritrichomonas foetus]|uniref:Uncharacterized protein n=1 Tax=Tritrichomonas foetus TaxID=1144522 RepID=A0A1J4JWJ6_9EUKA|nr:hypothetical protein TRFO_31197 [Tritrichomonas foetus]|eukprot:OHT01902.1 hypothetical protein TRFO_31197 [Tritrichomonas foetus]